jgi:vacuolar-type H+-ATPase subunit H
MKHIKKYRRQLTRSEQDKFRSQARQKAKHILSKKYNKEYQNLWKKIYRKIRRDYIKLKGG